MFIARLALPRRTFLRGVGAALGLPLLDAMVPALTAAAKTPANVKPRLGFVYVPHGVIMDSWTPKGAGQDFEFTPILKPLEPFRSALTIVSNLSQRTDHGQSQNCQAASPSLTEKKMICALPTRFSNGT